MEHERETQNVVNLVGIVRSAGTDDGVRPHRSGLLRHDLRRGVGHRQDQRRRGHLFHHLSLQRPTRRQAEEDVRARHGLGQRARLRDPRVTRFVRIHACVASLIDDAPAVGDHDIGLVDAEAHQQVQTGNRRRTRAGTHELGSGNVLADALEAIEHGGGGDDRGPVLIVMEHRDRQALAQPAFDLETFRRLDVFQIDATESRFQARDNVRQLVRIVLVDLDVEHVDAGELLEQAGLALHDRLAGQRADVAQAQYSRAIGHHRHQVAARSQFVGLQRLVRDYPAGLRDSR